MDGDSSDQVLTERMKALLAIEAIRRPKKLSILGRKPDNEELQAIRVIQKFYRGFYIRKQMKKLKLARCRELVVRNKFGLRSFPYGFVLTNQYEQSFRLTNIMDVTYNSKLGEVVIMDTRGISSWKKSQLERSVERPFLFEKYQSKYLRSIVYSQKMNVFYSISKDYFMKVINKDFEEIFEVNAPEARALFIVLNPVNDHIWSVGPDGVKIWALVKRPELNWNSVKAMVNYWLVKRSDFPNVGGGWTLNAYFDIRGEYFFACSEHLIVMYDLEGAEIGRVNQCHMGEITGVDRSDKSDFIVSCSHDSTVKVWKPVEKRLKYVFTFYCGKKLTGLTIHPKDAGIALVSSEDGFVKILSLDSFSELNRVHVSDHRILKMVITTDKQLVVATARNCFLFHLNYHYKYWATARTPMKSLELLESDGKTTRVQAVGTDSSIRMISSKGSNNFSTVLPPPNVAATHNVIGVTCLREYSLMYVLLDEQVVWVYTVRTNPACHIDAWNMARHQEEIIKELLDGYRSETFVRFPTAADLVYPVVENAYGAVSVVPCTTIACLNSKLRFFRKNIGYLYTDSSLFILVGLEDGRILCMDPLTSCKKHVDFRVGKHPIEMIRSVKESDILTTLSVEQVSKAFVSIWKLPDVEIVKVVSTTNDCLNYSVVARTLMTGHASGILNVYLWNTEKTNKSKDSNAARKRFRGAVKKVMAVHSFQKFSHADLEPDSDEDYVDLEKGQMKRKNTEHQGRVLNIQCNNYLQVFLSIGEKDHMIKIWSKSKTLLREVCLDATLSSACFVSNLGDIVFSYNHHLFFMSRFFLFPELKDIRDDYDPGRDFESYIHEGSELRFGAVAQHHKQPESLESYLIPFSLQENFYQSKESIIKWDQEGQRKVVIDDDGSVSTETSFDSLRADSETYASIGSFAENRYSHWDIIKPLSTIDAFEDDDFSTISGASSPELVNDFGDAYMSSNLTRRDPLLVAAKFRLPKMVSTPTPLSPILKDQLNDVIEGSEVADDDLQQQGAKESLEVIDKKDETIAGEPENEQAKPQVSIPVHLPIPPAKPVIERKTPTTTPISRAASKLSVVTPTPSTPSQPATSEARTIPQIMKKSATRSGRVSLANRRVRRGVTSDPETEIPDDRGMDATGSAVIVDRKTSSSSAKLTAKSAKVSKKSVSIEPPPLPTIKDIPQGAEIQDAEKHSISSRSYSAIQVPRSFEDTHGPPSISIEDVNHTDIDHTIKVSFSSKMDPRTDVKGTETEDLREAADFKSSQNQTEKVETFGISLKENDGYFKTYDKAALAAEKNMQWVEKTLLKNELRQRLKQQRADAVKNKKLQDMFNVWYKKQQFEDRQTSTSAEAFFKILAADFINHIVGSGMAIDEQSLPVALREMLACRIAEQSKLAEQFENEKAARPGAGEKLSDSTKSDLVKPAGPYRVPSMYDIERQKSTAKELAPINDDSRFTVEPGDNSFLQATNSRRQSLDLIRASSAGAKSRPASRLCKSASAARKPSAGIITDTIRRNSLSENVRLERRPATTTNAGMRRRKLTKEEFDIQRVQSAKSIPSKCTEYYLVRMRPASSSQFVAPSKTEKNLLAKRFPHIYEQAVGLARGTYSAPQK